MGMEIRFCRDGLDGLGMAGFLAAVSIQPAAAQLLDGHAGAGCTSA